ncbi:MAG: CHAD domain-containing protein [Campylobacterales bacterium]|nr:CHAD domain-containing protein [Campylobacterales bacterium]
MQNLHLIRYDITNINSFELLKELSESFNLTLSDEITEESSYFDTFEWLLYDKGVIFEYKNGVIFISNMQTETQIESKHAKIASILNTLDIDKLDFTFNIQKIIYPRTLSKKFSITTKLKHVEIKDDLQKTTLRVDIKNIYGNIDKEAILIGTFLVIKPLKGYEKPLSKMVSFCENKKLEIINKNLFELILNRLNIDTNFYNPAPKPKIFPNMKPKECFKKISQQLLSVMELNENGVKKNIDSEFLHDYRVAVRKIRALLNQLKKYFSDEEYLKLKNDFKQIGFYSGMVRDLDVYLLELDNFKNMLPDSMKDDLNPLVDYLKKEQQEEHKKLSKFLSSKEYKKSIEHFKHFLEKADEEDEEHPAIVKIAKKKISKLHREIIEFGEMITDETPDEKLHELRIECKKIRYLIEFFEPLFDSAKLMMLVKELKILQQCLGAYQDLFVQREKLKILIDKLPNPPTATIMAIGKLSGDLELKQKELRVEFYQKFKAFNSETNNKLYKELFYKIGE